MDSPMPRWLVTKINEKDFFWKLKFTFEKEKYMKRSFILLICMAGIFDACMPFCRADLKPDELFSLMRASRSRYVSIEATMEIKGFYSTDEKQENPALMYSQETLYRRAGGLVYAECITKSFSDTGNPRSHIKEIALLTPQGKKYYREEPIGVKHPYGHIDKNDDNQLSGWMSMTPDIIFWWNLEWPGLEIQYSKFLREHADKVSITLDQTSRFYVLDTPVGIEENAPHFRYTVDPSKGYMPTVQEWLDWDKTLVEKYVCSDYRLVNGLWAPFRYSIYITNGTRGTDVTIKSLSLNQPIAPDKFAFDEFPAGTHVIDRILGVSYTVGAKNNESDKQLTGGDSNALSTKLAPPATDAQLAQSALKAQELIAGEKQAASQTAPAIIPIEIVPSYVWVLPGKNEYVLSVSAGGKKPSLVKHTFEPDGLVVQGLENKIASDGKIRVSLERPAEHKAFADGILTFEFADQKKTVHFVAAPLE
jgi:hypothetical protein